MRYGDYWCNCQDIDLKRQNYTKYRKVLVDDEDICQHCGYYAIYQPGETFITYAPTEDRGDTHDENF